MTDKFAKLYEAQWKWASEAFGDDFGPEPVLFHLREESKELLDSPYDESEYADVLLLLMDAWHRSGRTMDELLDACEKKLEICKTRTWKECPDNPGVFYHVTK